MDQEEHHINGVVHLFNKLNIANYKCAGLQFRRTMGTCSEPIEISELWAESGIGFLVGASPASDLRLFSTG